MYMLEPKLWELQRAQASIFRLGLFHDLRRDYTWVQAALTRPCCSNGRRALATNLEPDNEKG
jgi:hypothetical protein